MNLIIALFVIASYAIGSRSIFKNKYKPSIYSRVIWLLLAINNLASVVLLKNNFSVLILAGLGLLGNLMILLLSVKKSQKTFGRTEIISTALLSLSLLIWIFTRLPILNLTIGLITHFIGGVPTYKKVINNPRDEDILFWFFFFMASLLAFLNIDRTNFSSYLYPLYFVLFDGLMTILSARRYLNKR